MPKPLRFIWLQSQRFAIPHFMHYPSLSFFRDLNSLPLLTSTSFSLNFDLLRYPHSLFFEDGNEDNNSSSLSTTYAITIFYGLYSIFSSHFDVKSPNYSWQMTVLSTGIA